MKKILFLLLICLIKLNAYHITVFYRPNAVNQVREEYYYDKNNNILTLKIVYSSGASWDSTGESFYGTLYSIKRNTENYITQSEFKILLRENLDFLNDFYLQQTQAILNYFYNDNPFYASNHVQYDNYELLYNSDGLAVESLINGVYAGLYNMDEMQFSGNLYNENGDLVLVNGVEPSFFQVLCDKLIGDLHLKMLDAENLIDKGWIFAVAFTLAIFYLIARALKRVLIGKNNKGVENES